MGIRLVVVDAHTLCRHGLARIAESHADIRLVAQMATAAEAMAGLVAADPDVVVLAAALPDGDGLRLAAALRERRPGVGVVVLGAPGHDDALFRAMEARASAYVTKAAPAEEIVAAIRHAAVAPASFTASGLAAALERRRQGELLSPREREVLALLIQGLSIAEIARNIHLSHSTAKTYTARIYEKLGATNRIQALMAALRLGLIPHDHRPATPAPALPALAAGQADSA
ncbi:response regulator transcription factor [Thermomonospora umbrina]|uniref:LuxR family two component transcriptional regulator n=1 Tax=Thermomonospora umbrina TaxID=111806 RepID=A0A3D9SLM2_9ACTN|nr:response regulator transcription factor [Thermomonospora umbrina]REE96809.1 LuxR family two component transcriptional regulator [Thermomonospora umbrina]